MVAQHYRWDFVGLSTDTKPTPATSEKVVDGSTFYCSDTSKLYVFCKDNWYERKALGGGGGGTTYTAGDGIDITDDTISVDTDTIQEKLTAGTGIDITNNTISATGGGGDTVYSNKSTSDSATGGAVYIGNLDTNQDEQPDPTTTDNHYKYFCALPSSNSSIPNDKTINILGSTPSPYSIVIGNNAADSTNSSANTNVLIGGASYIEGASYRNVIIGNGTHANNIGDCVVLGTNASCNDHADRSVALGSRSYCNRTGEVNIGTGGTNAGYNNTDYRVLGGVHDGQLANDAVTVGQINALIDAINSATNSNISHIGS